MKRLLHKIFLALIGIILIGKISNWFLHYNNNINEILNAGMFTLIGVAYLVGGYVWNNKLIKMIFIVCGLYLIGMNFIQDFELKSIIGIVSMLTPMLIARFSTKAENKKEMKEC
ncbi:MAG TPA: hypothetical protein PK504_02985 [Ferruginibacter sp.]|nr:hypothetical protein [Ferruginibacter sp.]HRE63659.1 hypothetical protein [Ferruginibacter sp.]